MRDDAVRRRLAAVVKVVSEQNDLQPVVVGRRLFEAGVKVLLVPGGGGADGAVIPVVHDLARLTLHVRVSGSTVTHALQ